jgi:hypothetical protein
LSFNLLPMFVLLLFKSFVGSAFISLRNL